MEEGTLAATFFCLSVFPHTSAARRVWMNLFFKKKKQTLTLLYMINAPGFFLIVRFIVTICA